MGKGWRVDREERWKRIVESRYNKLYKMVRGEGATRVLSEHEKVCGMEQGCKFGMGEEMKECKYCLNEEEKKCRTCGCERDDWAHVLRVSVEQNGIGERVRRMLDANGKCEG